tara:strand:- start:459 stop:746 length:288 start_codon:yes stop_codon:yes gene_type:complete
MDNFYAELNLQGAKALDKNDREKKLSLMRSLNKALIKHDWYYTYSDDNNAWEKGNTNARIIQENIIELINIGLKDNAITMYEKYAPHQYIDKEAL